MPFAGEHKGAGRCQPQPSQASGVPDTYDFSASFASFSSAAWSDFSFFSSTF
jgi:hypothetical protein